MSADSINLSLSPTYSAKSASTSSAKGTKDGKDFAATLKDIQDNGLTGWLKKTKEQEIQEKVRSQVLAGMGVTEGQLTGMSSADRKAIEQKIQLASQSLQASMIQAENDPSRQWNKAAGPVVSAATALQAI